MPAKNTSYRESKAGLKRIARIQFGVLSPEEIEEMSVAEITVAQTFQAGKPVENGLMDSHMGSIDRQFICATCSGDMNDCPGHFGHLKLARPMYNYPFIPFVLKILRCVCFHCSRILAPDDHKFRAAANKKNPGHRMRAVARLCQGRRICGGEDESKKIDQFDPYAEEKRDEEYDISFYLAAKKRNLKSRALECLF